MSWFDAIKKAFVPSIPIIPVEPLVSPTLGKAASGIDFVSRFSASLTGSAFGTSIIGTTSGDVRDNLFITKIQGGNVPAACRKTQSISVVSKGNLLVYQVASEYLSIGSDEDYLRITLSAPAARKMADSFDAMLPTKKMVDDIWKSADLKLEPHGMGGTPDMITTRVLVAHNQIINHQMAGKDFNLVAGTKKDIVLSKHLLTAKDRVCIYGWHHINGVVIQGQNSTSHDINYCDYSQAIRFVLRDALLNGVEVDLFDILNDPEHAYLISEEGAYDASSIYR